MKTAVGSTLWLLAEMEKKNKTKTDQYLKCSELMNCTNGALKNLSSVATSAEGDFHICSNINNTYFSGATVETLTHHLGRWTRWRWTARQFNSRPFKKQICAHKNPQHFSFLPWNQIANVLAASVAWASRSEVKQVTLPSTANFYCTVNMQTVCVLRSCLFRLIHSLSLAAFSSSQRQKFSVHLSITVARKQQPRPQRCHSKSVSALL